MMFKRANRIYWLCMFLAILLITGSCSNGTTETITRKGQEEVFPPPVFNSIEWPAPYTELTDEGRLVITGNLECPADYFHDGCLALYIFPEALIDPAVAVVTNPPPTHAELQQILLAKPKVQEWLSWVRWGISDFVTDGPSSIHEILDEYPMGAHCYTIAQSRFNDYNYVDFETGDFRIDLDEWARLNSGRKLLMLCGIDQAGQTTVQMNILDVPVLFPDLLDGLNSDAMEYGERMTALALALFDVLAVSGDGRGADILLMVPFFNLIEAAYSNGYNVHEGDIFIPEFKGQAADAAQAIGNPVYREAYLSEVDDVARIFDSTTWDAWSHHYTELEAQGNLLAKYQNAHQYTHDRFNEVTEQWNLIERGGGIKELTIQVYEGEDLISQISIIGDPIAPLLVTGFIGEHQIIADDYVPYFIEILGIFHEEWIYWPPYGI